MLNFVLLAIASFIDYKKQGFKEIEALFFLIAFCLIGLIFGFNILNFLVMFFLITFLIKKNILYEGDYLISAFAFTFTSSLVWLILALGLAYCFTIFYKEITKKTSTGFIPYFTISLLILFPLTLI